jgi:YbbR domain-containing protein
VRRPLRRLLAIVAHNWPLKLAAVGLASLLYVGLVLAQNSKEWRGPVPIEVRKQPADAVLTGGVQYVTTIRYVAPLAAAGQVGSESFTAWIDLSTATLDAANDAVVSVNVISPDPQIQPFDWTPRQIRVHLDPLLTKVLPVAVDKGNVPPGLDLREPVVDPSQVSVSGTQSIVSQVVAVLARVRIDQSGLSIDQQVDLVAVDGRGDQVNQVRLEPTSVRVRIVIGNLLQNRSLPVSPVVAGTPAAGFDIASVTVDPLVVLVEGEPARLSALSRIDTLPLSVTGATGDVTASLGLVLPPGIDLLGTDRVTVTVRLTATAGTRTFTAGPVLAGARDDRTYSLSTDQVLVTVGGASSALATVSGDQLVVKADVSGLSSGVRAVQLKATLPAGMTLIAISPPTLTVTVGVPATPAASP